MRKTVCRLVMLAVALAAGWSGLRPGSSSVGAAAPLTDLEGVGELQRLFDRDHGRVRLVLLLSPT